MSDTPRPDRNGDIIDWSNVRLETPRPLPNFDAVREAILNGLGVPAYLLRGTPIVSHEIRTRPRPRPPWPAEFQQTPAPVPPEAETPRPRAPGSWDHSWLNSWGNSSSAFRLRDFRVAAQGDPTPAELRNRPPSAFAAGLAHERLPMEAQMVSETIATVLCRQEFFPELHYEQLRGLVVFVMAFLGSPAGEPLRDRTLLGRLYSIVISRRDNEPVRAALNSVRQAIGDYRPNREAELPQTPADPEGRRLKIR